MRPWQTVGIDLLGPFPKSKSGNVWLLTVVDHFTRWPIAVPLKDAESSTIAAALFDKVVTEHGVPEKILSDQGKNLVSQGIITLCRRWGAAKVQTGGYNPQANGSCERFHRYLNAAMAILQETKSKVEWDEICSSAVFSYRVSTNDATGYSPFFLAHGYNPRLPLDAVFSTETATFQSEEQYVVQISTRLKSAFEQARKLQFAVAKENQDRDPKTQEPLLKEGDFCYVWAPGAGQAKGAEGSAVPKKWRFPWKGPYEITEHLGRAGCRLKVGKKCKSYPHNRLHKHVPWSDSVSTTSQWKLQEQPEARGKDEAKGERAVSSKIMKGDIVVFTMKMTKDNPRPWGLGIVLNDKNQDNLEIQWLGNTRENANGKFEPCWFQDSEKVYYYGMSKLHHKHTPYTTWDTSTTVGVADVILTNRTHIVLNNNNMMPNNTRGAVEDNYWVKKERRGLAQTR
jgi:transposase InsO family protein